MSNYKNIDKLKDTEPEYRSVKFILSCNGRNSRPRAFCFEEENK